MNLETDLQNKIKQLKSKKRDLIKSISSQLKTLTQEISHLEAKLSICTLNKTVPNLEEIGVTISNLDSTTTCQARKFMDSNIRNAIKTTFGKGTHHWTIENYFALQKGEAHLPKDFWYSRNSTCRQKAKVTVSYGEDNINLCRLHLLQLNNLIERKDLRKNQDSDSIGKEKHV